MVRWGTHEFGLIHSTVPLVQIWLVAYLVPSLCLNQYWLTVTSIRNKIQWNLDKNTCTNMFFQQNVFHQPLHDAANFVHVSMCWIMLTHWGRVTHICVGKLTIISSDNGLSPGRRQAIIWTNAGILLIGPLGTNFNEILCEIHTFSFKKMHFKMSSAKWRPFCLGFNVLNRERQKDDQADKQCWPWQYPLA